LESTIRLQFQAVQSLSYLHLWQWPAALEDDVAEQHAVACLFVVKVSHWCMFYWCDTATTVYTFSPPALLSNGYHLWSMMSPCLCLGSAFAWSFRYASGCPANVHVCNVRVRLIFSIRFGDSRQCLWGPLWSYSSPPCYGHFICDCKVHSNNSASGHYLTPCES
jgi:hypothetical protein